MSKKMITFYATRITATVVALFSILSVTQTYAQDPHGDFKIPAQDIRKEYQERGSLVSIKIIPMDKITKLFVVGNETASIKIDKINITGKIRVGQNEKVIQFNRQNDHFTTTDELVGDLDLQLELKDKKKKENFKLKVGTP